MSAFSYTSYLEAKRSVDDRALNQHVLGVLRRELADPARAIKALEIGAGIGNMVARLADWGVLSRADYLVLDADRASVDEAPRWLAAWASSTGRTQHAQLDALRIAGGAPQVDLTVRFACAELLDFLTHQRGAERPDLLIANAFLDLVDVPATLPVLFDRLAANGLYWFSINFDGESIFLPEHALDAPLMAAYHRSMDERVRLGRPAGDSRTGRHLFRHLRAAGASVLAAGSSDWVVHAIEGAYPGREGAFLENILHTIDAELSGRGNVDQGGLREWLGLRRDQLARAELVYIAHQLDFVGRNDR